MTRIQKTGIALACLFAARLASAAELKIGVFDFQRVSEETARGQELQASLLKFKDKKQAEITAKEGDLKALRDQYTAQALSLSPDKRAQMEKDIQKKDLDLQTFRESAQKEMQLELQEAQQKFQDQLIGVINALGKERGYTLIFAREQVAFYGDPVDITTEVVQKFNDESAKQAPPAAPDTKKSEPATSGGTPTPPKPAPAKPSPSKPGTTKPPAGGAPGGL